jgi:GNAT superfamily N-acetyltransferase
MLTVTPLAPADHADWERLFRGYIAFYERGEPQAMYDTAWAAFMADERLHALGARLDGALVGITHFFIHPNTSGPDVCYLQDLFTAETARGHGAGRALIAAVGGMGSEGYRALSGTGTIPCLRLDDGTPLPESAVILAYLEEKFPEPPPLPASPEAPAQKWLAASFGVASLAAKRAMGRLAASSIAAVMKA